MEILIKYHAGVRVELHDKAPNTFKYNIHFINSSTGQILFKDTIPANHFSQCLIQYYIPWEVKVYREHELIHTEKLNLENEMIVISFESSALGDNISWIPYVEEFRKKWNANVKCVTFHNHLFEKSYPNIEFINRGTMVQNPRAVYKIGWYGHGEKNNKNLEDCRTIPMQKIATNMLGLDYSEIRANVLHDSRPPLLNHPNYVVVTTSSTARMKYWNNPSGWQGIVNWLNANGYKVVNVGREKNNLHGVLDFTSMRPMNDIINYLQHAKFLIGIGSGLSWLNWALGKKTIMISGFSQDWCEYTEDNYRIINKSVCHGCFNDVNYTFNKGDWMHCPINKGNANHFICSKSITVNDVIEQVKKIETNEPIR